jgi:putative acetyltransferase
MLELVRPDSADLWGAARVLVEEYVAQLGVNLDFQDFSREIESLSREYGPPGGCFVLARQGTTSIGCGGVRRFDASACEMKRLYVTPGARGGRIGRALADALIAHARDAGYETMLLDTLPAMRPAQQLYAELGFTPTEPYRYNPVPGATFWKLVL